MQPEDVVRSCLASWGARDLEGTLAHFSEDCIYTLHVPTDVLPFGGRHEGRAAARTCLEAILANYSFLAYAMDWLKPTGANTVRTQIVYYYRHVETGEQIDGRFRLEFRVENGLVTTIDEYHDVPFLKAFLAMARGLGKT